MPCRAFNMLTKLQYLVLTLKQTGIVVSLNFIFLNVFLHFVYCLPQDIFNIIAEWKF